MIKKKSKIFVAGHNGLVGSAILRKLKKKGYKNIITVDRRKLDLTNQSKVLAFIKKKNQILFLSLLQKLAEFTQIKDIKQNLFIVICLYN